MKYRLILAVCLYVVCIAYGLFAYLEHLHKPLLLETRIYDTNTYWIVYLALFAIPSLLVVSVRSYKPAPRQIYIWPPHRSLVRTDAYAIDGTPKTPLDLQEGVLCPRCLARTPVRIGFCTQCGIPVHQAGSLDPIQSHILCQSFAIARAFDGKSSRFVKRGILLLFGAPLIQIYSLGEIRVDAGPSGEGLLTSITGSICLMALLAFSIGLNIAVIRKTYHASEPPPVKPDDPGGTPAPQETPRAGEGGGDSGATGGISPGHP